MSEIPIIIALAFIAGLVVGAVTTSIVKHTISTQARFDTIDKLERKAGEANRSRVDGYDYQSGRASGLETAIMLLSSETRR